jgi:hypothetical protein
VPVLVLKGHLEVFVEASGGVHEALPWGGCGDSSHSDDP